MASSPARSPAHIIEAACRCVTFSDPYGLEECDKDQQADGYKGCKESELPQGKCWTQQADGWRECTHEELLERVDKVGEELVREHKIAAASGVIGGSIAGLIASRLGEARSSARTALMLAPINPRADRILGRTEGMLAALPPGTIDFPSTGSSQRLTGFAEGAALMTFVIKPALKLP